MDVCKCVQIRVFSILLHICSQFKEICSIVHLCNSAKMTACCAWQWDITKYVAKFGVLAKCKKGEQILGI